MNNIIRVEIVELENAIKQKKEDLERMQNTCSHVFKVNNAGWFHTEYICTKCDFREDDMGL